MALPASNALIVGGGFSGMTAGIALSRLGISVDLVEIDPEWTCYGAGISIGGATLRAFRQLGLLERYLEVGNAGDGVDVRAPDGRKVAIIPTPRIAGPDVPGSGGIMRPVLARILADEVLACGVKVRKGCTFTRMEQDASAVRVQLSTGESGSYDLVVGADGLMSQVRKQVFPDAPTPRYNGQGVWRAVLPRRAGVDTTVLWVGDNAKVGLNPVSRDEMYLFVNENRPVKGRVDECTYVAYLKALLKPFVAEELREAAARLDESSRIVFRPIENLLLPPPWYAGRIVLIGDTVHATTPHLASGAGIGIEDAIVLADEIARHDVLRDALEAFGRRRWARCRRVVEDSARLGEIETQGGDKTEHARIMQRAFAALAEEI
jgi:2-polyprenyl-6-methoxyphenol hydroxylase-like FAD-dependent oxidoreductase